MIRGARVECEDFVNIKNKGFVILDAVFKEQGWMLAKNDFEAISYIKPGFDLDSFDISIDKTTIYVCVPMKNSPYRYKTSFTSYYEASEFIESRFNDFAHF